MRTHLSLKGTPCDLPSTLHYDDPVSKNLRYEYIPVWRNVRVRQRRAKECHGKVEEDHSCEVQESKENNERRAFGGGVMEGTRDHLERNVCCRNTRK